MKKKNQNKKLVLLKEVVTVLNKNKQARLFGGVDSSMGTTRELTTQSQLQVNDAGAAPNK